MFYSAVADFLVGIHFAFILFVALGGLLVLKRTWLALLHIPCVIWGIMIESQGWICPLTPLEIQFRTLAGDGGYTGGFIDHYLMHLIYPPGLTRTWQLAVAALLLAFNLSIYAYVVTKKHR